MVTPLRCNSLPSPLNPLQNCRHPSLPHPLPLSRTRDVENLVFDVVGRLRSGGCVFRALSIAIQDYSRSNFNSLTSPRRDQQAVLDYLVSQGCMQENICAMREDSADLSLLPTRRNILRNINWLVAGSRPGDLLVFHYSGHGTQVNNRTGTEKDKEDEALVTMDRPHPDHSSHHLILDNVLRSFLVDQLPSGVTLIAIVDACNSETILDLDSPRMRRPLLGTIEDALATSNPASLLAMYSPFASGDNVPNADDHDDKRLRTERGRNASRKSSTNAENVQEPRMIPTATGAMKRSLFASPERYEEDNAGQPNVICISACKDNQLAWECGGKTVTHDVISLLKKNALKPLSFKEFENRLHRKVGRRKVKGLERSRAQAIDPSIAQALYDRQMPKITTLPGFEDLLHQPFRFLPLVHRRKIRRNSADIALELRTNQLPAL